jgi:hypothetical protein
MLKYCVIQRGSAGTGRRAWLRTMCRKAWGFESPLPHHPLQYVRVQFFTTPSQISAIVFSTISHTTELMMVNHNPARRITALRGLQRRRSYTRDRTLRYSKRLIFLATLATLIFSLACNSAVPATGVTTTPSSSVPSLTATLTPRASPPPDNQAQEKAQPTSKAAITKLDPATGTVGQLVQLVGQVTSCGDPYSVFWDNEDNRSTLGRGGSTCTYVVMQFRVPQTSLGKHSVILRDDISGETAAYNFEVSSAP